MLLTRPLNLLLHFGQMNCFLQTFAWWDMSLPKFPCIFAVFFFGLNLRLQGLEISKSSTRGIRFRLEHGSSKFSDEIDP